MLEHFRRLCGRRDSVKVFLFDTAQLDGLWRALSFAMLGVCLIGIGWFYMRAAQKSPKDGDISE